LVKAGIMFVGTPDDVYGQLAEFIDNVGGLGHFLMMGHAGHLTHAAAVDQITLVATEVLPRLHKLRPASKQAA
jgi:alkanesulfonate monooxygenase SsuD/methylene tetrahydromethanopterin reductase-like flavin-dependent oxidoreductase (luciferase family)